jgi:hypothetical protein
MARSELLRILSGEPPSKDKITDLYIRPGRKLGSQGP